MNQVNATKYDYNSWQHIWAMVTMLGILAVGNAAGKAMTPQLPSTLTVVGALVGVLAYTFIMMKGRENRWKAFLQMSLLSIGITAGFWLRHDLIMSDPEVMALKTVFTACGDSVQNLCTVAHWKYVVLVAWL